MGKATYAIEFRFPEGIVYAGMSKGALGWAPTIATALFFATEDEALQMLNNGYDASAEWGYVVPVVTTPA